jgi:starvation-inducible DNA-binding protein
METQGITELLGRLVADTYVLAFTTQSFHWNVRGGHFAPLHELFGSQYDELVEAADELAERMRALGALAPASLPELLKSASLPLDPGAPRAKEMVDALRKGHERLASAMRKGAETADAAGDAPTGDLLIQRAQSHEKAAWMLRATLEE